MANRIIQIGLFISLVAFCLGMGFFRSDASSEPEMRIAILKDEDNVVLSIHGEYAIVDLESGQEVASGKRLRKSRIMVYDNGLYIGKNFFKTRHLRVRTTKEARVYVPSRVKRYRGIIDILVKNDKVWMINQVDLETYIKGVLYHEVTHRWPMEAMKAQAVAARSYALYQREQNRGKPFDVTSDIYSQVYGGRSAERYRTNLAVDRTKGEVLLYKGEILPAYFHSNCGGHTENVKELWKHDLLPLKGVRCLFCAQAPNAFWKKNFRLKDIQEKLNAGGYPLGLIQDIRVLSRNESGRIKKIKITARDNQFVILSGKDFRQIIGPNEIKSNNYEIRMQGYYADFIGKGWGHGVGLCQWGAFEMAKKHYNYKEILRFYYPGAKVTRQ